MSDVERKAVLAKQIQMAVVQGRRIESQSDFQAVLVSGKKLNNVLHAVLTVCTVLWGVVWIILAITGGEKRELLVIDGFGNVQLQALGKS